MKPQELATKLQEMYGDNLVSVMLYGSSAGGDFSKRYSDVNLIVVLKSVAPGELAKANGVLRRWVKRGQPPPLFFDAVHFPTAADVFPIEFLDLARRHHILAGSDPLAGITVARHNLRHECESELRGKLLRLRQTYLLTCHRPKRVAREMVQSLSAIIAILRGVVHLLDQEPRPTPRELIEQLERGIDFNPQAFFDLLAIREGSARLPRGDEALALVERYLTELETITKYVDTLLHKGATR